MSIDCDVTGSLRSLPDSLLHLDVSAPKCRRGHRLVLPAHLEVLSFSSVRLNQLVFPPSIREIDISVSYGTSLQEYDDQTSIDGPEWTKLVNLKILRVHMPRLGSIAHWHPPPNLRELNLPGKHVLPVFPPELNSSHTLKTTLPDSLLPADFQLPRNLKVWDCDTRELRGFRVPKLVCDHPSLQILALRRIGDFRSNPFPKGFTGNLILELLDLLSIFLPRVYSNRVDPEESAQFYADVERAFGRVVSTRPLNVYARHFLTTRD